MIRLLVRYLGVVGVGIVIGALMAGFADVLAADLISETLLGPDNPRSPEAWSVIGIIATELSLRRRGS